MNTNSLTSTAICIFQIVLFVVASSITALAQGTSTVELKAVSFAQTTSLAGRQFRQFVEKAEKQSKGKMRIKYL